MRFIRLFRVSTVFVIAPLLSASSNYAFSQLATASFDTAFLYTCIHAYYEPWGHKINAQWHTDTEAWYMYVRDVPNVAGNVTNFPPTEVGANDAFCSAGEKTCFAPELAVVNYLEHEISPRRYLSIRNEFVDDIKSRRTGCTTRHSEHMIDYDYWIGSTVLFRPELRLEHSYDLAAYDLDTRYTQFATAGDITYHF